MRTRSREVRWTAIAERDLWEIIHHIAQDRPFVAETVFRELRARAEALSTLPERGRVVPELEKFGSMHYRELIHPPWRILYRPHAGWVEVMAVLDARRNVEDLLLKRFSRPE